MTRWPLCVGLIGMLTAALPVSAQVENLGAITPKIRSEAQQVIDRRCTVCHTRQRIETALQMQRDMGEIQQRMLDQGAVLSEREKNVLGTFWGSPLKEAPPQRTNP